MKIFIYALRHPKTNDIFYIGQTKNIFNRLSTHFLECYRGTRPKDDILRRLKQDGISPIIETLEEIEIDGVFLERKKVCEREKYWIDFYKEKFTLSNIEHNPKIINDTYISPTSKNCKYCEKEFEPNKPKQVFCSPKCRVYFNRDLAKKINGVLEKEINKPHVKAAMKKANEDLGTYGLSITKVSKGNIEAVPPQSEQAGILLKITEYETELKTIPDSGLLSKKRKEFVQEKISGLKRQLK